MRILSSFLSSFLSTKPNTCAQATSRTWGTARRTGRACPWTLGTTPPTAAASRARTTPAGPMSPTTLRATYRARTLPVSAAAYTLSTSSSEVAAFLLPRPQRRCCCADRLLGGAICSWSNPQVIEDLMFFGECFGNRSRYTDPALSGPGHPRPSPRAPIVAERLWAGAAQKPQAVLEAVVRTILRPTARAFHLLLAVPAPELLFQRKMP